MFFCLYYIGYHGIFLCFQSEMLYFFTFDAKIENKRTSLITESNLLKPGFGEYTYCNFSPPNISQTTCLQKFKHI